MKAAIATRETRLRHPTAFVGERQKLGLSPNAILRLPPQGPIHNRLPHGRSVIPMIRSIRGSSWSVSELPRLRPSATAAHASARYKGWVFETLRAWSKAFSHCPSDARKQQAAFADDSHLRTNPSVPRTRFDSARANSPARASAVASTSFISDPARPCEIRLWAERRAFR